MSVITDKRVTRQKSSKQELDKLRSIVHRCISDMNVQGLSEQQRFLIAYDAGRTLALMAVRACGYRPKKIGGHYNTFLGLAVCDPTFAQTAAYLDLCRLKRNDSEYDSAGGISQSDAADIAKVIQQFEQDITNWLKANYPALS